jgi:hypothetical protein
MYTVESYIPSNIQFTGVTIRVNILENQPVSFGGGGGCEKGEEKRREM